MNSKTLMLAWALAASISGNVWAETNAVETASEPQGFSWAMGEGVTYNETSIVSTEFAIGFDSKYLSYGLVDNNDPIWTVGGEMTFFDWVTLGSSAIFDMSRYGVDAGYKNRKGKAIEYHPSVNIGHSFSPDDYSFLPTTIELNFNYDYEYHPRVCTGAQWVDGEYCEGAPRGGDTYFYTFEVALPDLWVEPTFYWEHDGMRDHGNYLNLALGHTFSIIDGKTEDDDPVLSICPNVSQGWGDERRISAYLTDIHSPEESGLEHQGLMDTRFSLDLTWNIAPGIALAGYVAYSDYLFDPSTREASRHYEATGYWTDSWNFVTGATLSVSF